EIPAPASGTLLKILVAEGTTVKAGTVVALIGQPEEMSTAGQLESAAPAPAASSTTAAEQTAAVGERTNGSARTRFTPVVARMISEFNITEAELKTIAGTGANGRISKKDI